MSAVNEIISVFTFIRDEINKVLKKYVIIQRKNLEVLKAKANKYDDLCNKENLIIRKRQREIEEGIYNILTYDPAKQFNK